VSWETRLVDAAASAAATAEAVFSTFDVYCIYEARIEMQPNRHFQPFSAAAQKRIVFLYYEYDFIIA